MKTIAAILAGGSGTRIGGTLPKQLLPLGGKPVLEHSVATFNAHPRVDAIVIVCREDLIPTVQEIVSRGGYGKVRAVVPGGDTRFMSSLAAIRAAMNCDRSGGGFPGGAFSGGAVSDGDLSGGAVSGGDLSGGAVSGGGFSGEATTGLSCDIAACDSTDCGDCQDAILLHDAARPLVDEALIDRCLDALAEYDAVAPAIPLADTVVRVDDAGHLADVPPRAALRAVQTPQCFRLSVLADAYRRALNGAGLDGACTGARAGSGIVAGPCIGADSGAAAGTCLGTDSGAGIDAGAGLAAFTDDISVVRHCFPELPVKIVDGSPRNIKLTVPSDLPILEALLG